MSDHANVNPLKIGVSTGGNTAGATGLTDMPAVLVGSNGITLSQATAAGGATVTILGAGTPPAIATSVSPIAAASSVGTVTRYAPEDHQHAGVAIAGVSTQGNTAGLTGLFPGNLQFVGTGEVSLAAATDASGVTISIGGPSGGVAATAVSAVGAANVVGTNTGSYALEDHVHAGVAVAGISTDGNTAGATGLAPGNLQLVALGIASASQATDASGVTVSISVPAAAAGPSIATSVEAISAAGSVGTVTRYAPEDHRHAGVAVAGISTDGNTAGATGLVPGNLQIVGLGVLSASQGTDASGVTVSLSVPAAAAGPSIATSVEAISAAGSVGTVTRYAPEDHKHAGVAVAGISTDGNTAGATGLVPGNLQIVGLGVLSASQGTDASGVTVSLSVPAAAAGPSIATSVSPVAAASSVGTVTRYAPEDHVHPAAAIATSVAAVGAVSSVGTVTRYAPEDHVHPGITAAPVIGTAVKTIAAAASVGTITRYAPEDHQHVGVAIAGVSTDGNTAGTTGLGAGNFVIVGSHIITASQSSDSLGVTVTLDAQTFAGADVVSAFGVSTAGNTAGDTGTKLGTIVLQATGGVTLSQATAAGNKQTIQISVGTAVAPSIATSVKAVGAVSSVGTVTRYAPEDHVHVGAPAISASIWKNHNAIQSNLVASSNVMTIMPASFFYNMSATMIQLKLGGMTQAHDITAYAGIYTMAGSTASMASSGSLTTHITLGGGGSTITNIVIPIGTWNISPGIYMIGVALRATTSPGGNAISDLSILGQSNTQDNILAFNMWQAAVRSAASAGIPASCHITDFVLGSPIPKPTIELAGSF